MGRPKGSKNKTASNPPVTLEAHAAEAKRALDPLVAAIYEDEPPANPALNIPADWQIGALLNVRNGGEAYVVTLYPEEADWRHPERTLRFTNQARCQDFISRWYARQSYDPRAF